MLFCNPLDSELCGMEASFLMLMMMIKVKIPKDVNKTVDTL